MPGVRTGFAHVVAPLTEGKVTEFLLENGAHPFHFCPSPPVSLLFLSLTMPEKKRRPWGGSSLLENRSVIMGVGNVLSGRFWGESFPGEMLHREPPKFRMMSRAVRGQMHMLRPYGYRKGRRPGNSRRMIPFDTGRNGYACFSTQTFSVCGSVARGSAYELHLVPVHHIHALGECHADTAFAVVEQASRHVDDADLGIG